MNAKRRKLEGKPLSSYAGFNASFAQDYRFYGINKKMLTFSTIMQSLLVKLQKIGEATQMPSPFSFLFFRKNQFAMKFGLFQDIHLS